MQTSYAMVCLSAKETADAEYIYITCVYMNKDEINKCSKAFAQPSLNACMKTSLFVCRMLFLSSY